MRLPFNLDLKSMIVGAVIVYFVVPFVLSKMNRPMTSKNDA